MKPSDLRRTRRVWVTKNGYPGRLTVASSQERGCDDLILAGWADDNQTEQVKFGFEEELRETIGWLDGAHDGSVEDGRSRSVLSSAHSL